MCRVELAVGRETDTWPLISGSLASSGRGGWVQRESLSRRRFRREMEHLSRLRSGITPCLLCLSLRLRKQKEAEVTEASLCPRGRALGFIFGWGQKNVTEWQAVLRHVFKAPQLTHTPSCSPWEPGSALRFLVVRSCVPPGSGAGRELMCEQHIVLRCGWRIPAPGHLLPGQITPRAQEVLAAASHLAGLPACTCCQAFLFSGLTQG